MNMNMNRKLALTFLCLVALLGAWWASGGATDGPGGDLVSTDAARVQASRERVPHSEMDGSRQVERLDDAAALTSALVVHVKCTPRDAEFSWTAELYREPTMSSARRLVSTKRAKGSETFEWAAPAGRVGVRIVSPGAFGENWLDVDLVESDAVVHDKREVTLHLSAAARVRGRVTDPQGNPVRSVRVLIVPSTELVRASSDPFLVGPPRRDFSRSVETDEAGLYSIGSVDPRRAYTGAVAHPSFKVAREYGVAPPAGGEAVMNFVLHAGGQVRGRLIDTDLKPIVGAQLRMAASDTSLPGLVSWRDEGASRSDSDGRFKFGALAPGWKKIETIVSAEPGLSVVGIWELDIVAGAAQDLGDLIVGRGSFEAQIVTPEGPVRRPAASVRFFAATDASSDRAGALSRVPVLVDENGVLRIQGLGSGRVSSTVNEDLAQADGWYRPRSDFDTEHDGVRTSATWMLNALVNGESPVAAAKRQVSRFGLKFKDRQRGDLAFIWVDGELAVMGSAYNGELSVEVENGDAIRLVVTDGDRYTEEEFALSENADRATFRPGDRDGHELVIRVEDDGRGVPDVYVRLGTVDSGEAPFVIGRTNDEGVLRLRGLPPSIRLLVTAEIGVRSTPLVAVKWAGGRAEVTLDASED